MALTPEQQGLIEGILMAAIQSRPAGELSTLSTVSTSDLQGAAVNVIAKLRAGGMTDALTPLITPAAVNSFPTLRAAASLADGATLGPELRAFAAALANSDAAGMTIHAMAACVAALKQYDIPIEAGQ